MAPGPIRPLTARQLEVVQCIVRGCSYAEGAAAIGCQPRTFETHVRQIAMLIDGLDELPPRWRIYTWAKHAEWERSHQQQMPRPA